MAVLLREQKSTRNIQRVFLNGDPLRSRLGNKSRGIIAAFSEPRAPASGPAT
jgi:hypothetical protein